MYIAANTGHDLIHLTDGVLMGEDLKVALEAKLVDAMVYIDGSCCLIANWHLLTYIPFMLLIFIAAH